MALKAFRCRKCRHRFHKIRFDKSQSKKEKLGALWIVLASLAVIIVVGTMISFPNLFPSLNQLRTLTTVKKVDDFPLYEMYYHGDYDFVQFLQKGISAGSRDSSSARKVDERWVSTCFSALNPEGDLILGRNFDWYSRPALILFTDPPEGYASVSMVDMTYLGYTGDDKLSWADRRKLLDAPYLPLEGMNECGLAVGMNIVPYGHAGRDLRKTSIHSLHAIRLMLDYALDLDEAVSLLKNYNIVFAGGYPLHYLISDAYGASAIIEFTEDGMVVIRNTEPWQVATNIVFSDTTSGSRCWRYRKAYESLEQAGGVLLPEEAMDLLKEVSQSDGYPTAWSSVYNMTRGSVQVVAGRKYESVHEFALR